MPGSFYINESWKNIVGGGFKLSDNWRNLKTGWQNNNGVWNKILPTFSGTGVTIPSGGIVPWYSSGSVPSGWSLWADDARVLRGWDGTVGTIGSTGGTRSISFTTSTDPSHTSTAFNSIGFNYVNNWSNTNRSSYASGGHSHTASDDASSRPALALTQLIQANSNQSVFPAGTIVLGDTGIGGGVSEITTSEHYLYIYANGGVSRGQLLSATTSSSFTTSSVGNHQHHTTAFPYSYAGFSGYYSTGAGAHAHSFTVSNISWNMSRVYMKAFSNLLTDFPCTAGSVIGWESGTAPDGWGFCDGTNGTYDLRNYFICCDSSQTPGSTAGGNTVSFSYTTNTAGAHHHYYGNPEAKVTRSGYHSDDRTHSHSGSQNISQLFPYMNLAFIQAL